MATNWCGSKARHMGSSLTLTCVSNTIQQMELLYPLTIFISCSRHIYSCFLSYSNVYKPMFCLGLCNVICLQSPWIYFFMEVPYFKKLYQFFVFAEYLCWYVCYLPMVCFLFVLHLIPPPPPKVA